MRCINPYIINDIFRGKIAVPCRKCELCRVILKQDWTARLQLEGLCYEDICFTTLTYSDKCLPLSDNGNPTLCYRDIQLFLKRLRKQLDYKIRFFCVGEYGSSTRRPHYHLILFGLKKADYGKVNFSWAKGIVDLKVANQGAFKYVSGYVNKKFDKYSVENDVFPEFIRTSQGLGRDFVKSLSKSWVSDNLVRYNDLYSMPDISSEILINGKKVRLPRYVRNKLRDAVFSEGYIGKLKNQIFEKMKKDHYDLMFSILGFTPIHDAFYVSEVYLKANEARLIQVRKIQEKIKRKRIL